jgi:hypothetical protein
MMQAMHAMMVIHVTTLFIPSKREEHIQTSPEDGVSTCATPNPDKEKENSQTTLLLTFTKQNIHVL